LRVPPPSLRRLLAGAALFAAAAAGAAEPPPQSPPLDPGAHYAACLDAARRTPDKGLGEAEDWRRAGGGYPAEHCTAVALFGLKRYREAAALFQALAGDMMAEPPALRAGAMEQAGQAWLLAADPEQARGAFDAALKFTPRDPDLFIDRARADAEMKRFPAAIEDLDSALTLAPGSADALIYRASAYRQEGELQKAAADVEAALKAVPDDVEGLLERGNIRRLEGDLAGARADWARVAALAPASPAAAAARDNLAKLAPPPK
jgi:tetratricopeptide (TPR) repeat protein